MWGKVKEEREYCLEGGSQVIPKMFHGFVDGVMKVRWSVVDDDKDGQIGSSEKVNTKRDRVRLQVMIIWMGRESGERERCIRAWYKVQWTKQNARLKVDKYGSCFNLLINASRWRECQGKN